MNLERSFKQSQRFRLDTEKGEFIPEIDWDAYENCQTCRGLAELDETPHGDLVCKLCKAQLPRPQT